MNKRVYYNIVILFLFFLYVFIYGLVIIPKLLKYEDFILASFLLILVFISVCLYGYKKAKKNKNQSNMTWLIILESFLFYFGIIAIGFFKGFLINSYSLSKIAINIFFPIIIIISEEILRNIVIKANKDKLSVVVAFTIAIILIELMRSISIYNFTNISAIFLFITIGLLPLIAKHILLSFLSYHTNLRNNLIYCFIELIYIFCLPIQPNLGDFLYCVLNILFPFVVYLSINRIITSRDRVIHDFYVKRFTFIDAIYIFILLGTIILISGNFKYKMISIGSDSMYPTIEKGDVVIIEKIKDISVLKQGDIIAFNENGKTIVHRIYEIEVENNEIYITTKGDQNNTKDNYQITNEQINGKVVIRLKCLGYPSLWLSNWRDNK